MGYPTTKVLTPRADDFSFIVFDFHKMTFPIDGAATLSLCACITARWQPQPVEVRPPLEAVTAAIGRLLELVPLNIGKFFEVERCATVLDEHQRSPATEKTHALASKLHHLAANSRLKGSQGPFPQLPQLERFDLTSALNASPKAPSLPLLMSALSELLIVTEIQCPLWIAWTSWLMRHYPAVQGVDDAVGLEKFRGVCKALVVRNNPLCDASAQQLEHVEMWVREMRELRQLTEGEPLVFAMTIFAAARRTSSDLLTQYRSLKNLSEFFRTKAWLEEILEVNLTDFSKLGRLIAHLDGAISLDDKLQRQLKAPQERLQSAKEENRRIRELMLRQLPDGDLQESSALAEQLRSSEASLSEALALIEAILATTRDCDDDEIATMHRWHGSVGLKQILETFQLLISHLTDALPKLRQAIRVSWRHSPSLARELSSLLPPEEIGHHHLQALSIQSRPIEERYPALLSWFHRLYHYLISSRPFCSAVAKDLHLEQQDLIKELPSSVVQGERRRSNLCEHRRFYLRQALTTYAVSQVVSNLIGRMIINPTPSLERGMEPRNPSLWGLQLPPRAIQRFRDRSRSLEYTADLADALNSSAPWEQQPMTHPSSSAALPGEPSLFERFPTADAYSLRGMEIPWSLDDDTPIQCRVLPASFEEHPHWIDGVIFWALTAQGVCFARRWIPLVSRDLERQSQAIDRALLWVKTCPEAKGAKGAPAAKFWHTDQSTEITAKIDELIEGVTLTYSQFPQRECLTLLFHHPWYSELVQLKSREGNADSANFPQCNGVAGESQDRFNESL